MTFGLMNEANSYWVYDFITPWSDYVIWLLCLFVGKSADRKSELTYKIEFKDTVTILKFLFISDFFSNRWFWWDNAGDVSSLSLTNNCSVWILLFWGQSRWLILMTSSNHHSKRLIKNGKNIRSRNLTIILKFWALILFDIIGT